MAINTAFYPTLMWNSRFHAPSGDPFDNRQGFVFPAPEGTSLSYLPHLLTAQAFIPPTERVEAAGFHFPGGNDDIRREVVRRLNASAKYRQRFARSFAHVKARSADHVRRHGTSDRGVRVHARVRRRADRSVCARPRQRVERGREARRRAVLWPRRLRDLPRGVGQVERDVQRLPPARGRRPADRTVVRERDVRRPGANEDFGLEQVTGNAADRYAFRTSPLRNVALQPAFMHNGAFTRLEDAIRYHLDAVNGAASFTTDRLPPDLRGPTGPIRPVLERLDPLLRTPATLTEEEIESLVAFVRDGLLDPDARPQRLRRLIPEKLPSGRPGLVFP